MPFQIFIKTLNGKTITADVENNTTITDIKNIIFKKTKIPIKYHYLKYKYHTLRNNDKLSKYNIFSENTLHMKLYL